MAQPVLQHETPALEQTRPLAELAPVLSGLAEQPLESRPRDRTPVAVALVRSVRPPAATPKAPPPAQASPAPPQPAGSPENDRRAFPRYRGPRLKVLMADAEVQRVLFQGELFDYSEGGLGISGPQFVEKGAVLSVRVITRQKSHWVQVEVKDCRQHSGQWVLGCQFVRPPRADMLRQFA